MGPTLGDWVTDEILSAGERLGIEDMSFDSSQYLDEVKRASADSSWETDRRKTARLLGEYLEGESKTLERSGQRFGWASPELDDTSAYRVCFWRDALRQIVVEVRSEQGSPEDRAAKMAEQLLRGSSENWDVVFAGEPLLPEPPPSSPA